MNEILANLLENAKNIYHIYKKLQEGDVPQNELLSALKFLRKKEETSLKELEKFYASNLLDLAASVVNCFTLYESTCLENYIISSEAMIPALRILEKLYDLIEKNMVDIKRNNEEVETEYYNHSYQEYILENIAPALDLENAIHFMNTAKRYEKETDELRQITYDMTFLHTPLEDLFIEDGLLNPSYKLFETKVLLEEDYDPASLNQTIERNNIDQFEKQIKNLASTRKTKNIKIALLRTIYIESLSEALSEDTLEDSLVNMREIIDTIPYPFDIIKQIQERTNNILYLEYMGEETETQKKKTSSQKQKHPQK
jgi:hypothetical protein